MRQEILDEVIDGEPRYNILDRSDGTKTIELANDIIEPGTPINRQLFNNLQGDLYTVDRYNMVTFEQRILEVDYITDILVTETQHIGNCIPQSEWQPIAENNNYVFTSNGWQIKDDWTIGTATNNVTNAFDGDTNTKFQSKNGTGYANIIINCPYPVKITKMKTFIGTTASSDFSACAIQGYKDGEWINIYNYGSNYQTQLTEIEITNPDYFEQYQIYLSTISLGEAYISEIEVSEYYTGVFGVRGYSANLDLPLTSYEKNKKISIEMADKILDSGTGETYIETIDNPSININSKGAKKINGSIKYGRKYELVYNGESWDITTKYVTGSFTASSSLQTIELGFEPDIVIVYNSNNNYDRVAVNSSGNANYHHVPRILTKSYLSPDGYGQITINGFTFKGQGSATPVEYYIAIQF